MCVWMGEQQEDMGLETQPDAGNLVLLGDTPVPDVQSIADQKALAALWFEGPEMYPEAADLLGRLQANLHDHTNAVLTSELATYEGLMVCLQGKQVIDESMVDSEKLKPFTEKNQSRVNIAISMLPVDAQYRTAAGAEVDMKVAAVAPLLEARGSGGIRGQAWEGE